MTGYEISLSRARARFIYIERLPHARAQRLGCLYVSCVRVGAYNIVRMPERAESYRALKSSLQYVRNDFLMLRHTAVWLYCALRVCGTSVYCTFAIVCASYREIASIECR